MTLIKDLFEKPLNRSINGVVKADQSDAETVWQELEEYVVTNELEAHFRDFFEGYTTDLKDRSIANKVGIWVSGFFGSGKSHFLKILSYLLENKTVVDSQGEEKKAVEFFGEGKLRDATIRANVEKVASNPADVVLFNIDSKASTSDTTNPILNVFLRVFNEHQGFSSDHPHIAHMERHLTKKNAYDAFRRAFEEVAGATWESERDAYHFYQDEIEQAISKALELSPEAARKWFEEAEDTFSVSVENFCHWVKEYLDSVSPVHRMVFMVDEVGQFIGSDTRLMLTLQTLTENLGTICGGRAWLIVTAQADMDSVLKDMTASKANDFSKIAGRFKTRLSLSSSNTDEVIQRRLLSKKESVLPDLENAWEEKGDVLRNQLTFDQSGPTLRNYEGPQSFVANYPFAPYHFQLVQKVFEEIRKVGATGAHLAYGERSMLDAFQMAAKSIADEQIGALVPMHAFYRAVEGFLDTAVKRTIDQAGENQSLDDFDINILRVLFMIRYVDLIKGTLDNLITLSIEQIDEDRLALRRQMEETLHRLEKENLITRSGDEFVFLTNEERDITRKIKATDISGADENRALADLIFKDLLKDKNKFRYHINKTDYSIGRYLDGHPLDGRYDADLVLEVVSPLDPDYAQYTEAGCINKSAERNGQGLIKLGDDKEFFNELRTWLKTNKFIRLNDDGSNADLTRILADRGRENQERRKRLRATLENRLLEADCYALGQHLQLGGSSLNARIDEICEYLLENTYTKLGFLENLQQDPMRELSAVLSVDDISQMGLSLDGEEGNPKAVKEVEQYINLRADSNERLLVSDIVTRFEARPYGWPVAEILLILGRLAAAGRISFNIDGGPLPLNEAFESLNNTRRRREVSVQKKRKTEDSVLRQARDLTKELFHALGPDNEKELFGFYQSHLQKWLSNLQNYKSKTDVGAFPGKDEIDKAILTLNRLLANSESYDFFQEVVTNQNTYLDLQEDYQDLHEFFTKQLHTWQQLQSALSRFENNRRALEREENAKKALDELRTIYEAPAPYSLLHKVAGLIETVEAANCRILDDKRAHAVKRVEEKINLLKAELAKSAIDTPELSNRLLRPLQLVKQSIEAEDSVANIYMLQTQTAQEKLDESLEELERAIQAEAEEQPNAPHVGREKPDESENTHSSDDTAEPVRPPKPMPVVEVSAGDVFSKVNGGIYLETEEDADRFAEALKEELKNALAGGKRVRLK